MSESPSTFLPRRATAWGCIGACGLLLLLGLAGLAVPATWATPGPADWTIRLTLDPLAGCFLLLLAIGLLACAVCEEVSPLLPAGALLTLLAGDPLTLAVGLLLLGSGGTLRLAMLAAVATTVSLALVHAAEPSAIVPALATIGACALAVGLLRDAAPAAAVCATVAIYLPMRLLIDPSVPPLPVWASLVPLLAGGLAVLPGALFALFGATPQAVLSSLAGQQLGMAAIGIGVALLARVVDRPDLVLLALQAGWLWTVGHALLQALGLLGARAVETASGTRLLGRLGGLVHFMPLTTASMGAGMFGAAMLPPGLGFAALWLLIQALLGLAKIGGLGLQLLVAVVALAVALTAGLVPIALLRLFGVAFLGRPRTPRTSVTEEPKPPLRAVLPALAGLTLLLGVFPGLTLGPAAPALDRLAGGNAVPTPMLLALRAGAQAPGYSPIAVGLLLALVAGPAVWVLRQREKRREAAWSGGFEPPPRWLPFGDPATQYGPASFAEPVRLVLGTIPVSALDAGWSSALRRIAERTREQVTGWSVGAAIAVSGLAAAAWVALS